MSIVTLACVPFLLLVGVALVGGFQKLHSGHSSVKAMSIIIIIMLYTTLANSAFELFACEQLMSMKGLWLRADMD